MTRWIFAKWLMNKVLIDTNVIIYSIDEESKYFNRAQDLIYNDRVKLFTTSKNIAEFLAVITRPPQFSLVMKDALQIVQDLNTICSFVYPNSKSLQIFTELLRKYEPTGLKIHDFDIISIALAHKLNTIVTFNTKDFAGISEVSLHKM